MKRGHETLNHVRGKALLAELLKSQGYWILVEHKCSDVVAVKNIQGRLRMVCAEHELSPRNTISNIQRNFRQGCDAIIILVASEKLRLAIRNKLRRMNLGKKVAVVLHAQLASKLKKS